MALGGVWREAGVTQGKVGGEAQRWDGQSPGTGEYLGPTGSHGVCGQEVGSA